MTSTTEIDFMSITLASIYSTFRMIAIAICGGLFVKYKMIDRKIMKGIAEICANLLIPSLIIAEILKSFKISEYQIWLPILIYCLVCVVIGFIISFILAKMFCLDDDMYRLTLICCMFSNSTSMQLVYVDCLSSTFAKYLNITNEKAKSSGNIVVLLYTIFVNFLRWSIGFYIMKPSGIKEVEQKYMSKIEQQDGNDTHKIGNIKKNKLLLSEGDSANVRDIIQFEASIDFQNTTPPTQPSVKVYYQSNN